MSCISPNLPYFKELLKTLNVGAPALKQVLHKLQRDYGHLNFSPEEVDLHLQGNSLEFGENSLKLYEQRYKEPLIVSPEEYKSALDVANSAFPKGAVTSYQTADGNYVIRVAEPTNSILKNAKRDTEGKLLAPNGKVSNLTELQYVQVRTPLFKRWFGDWENDSVNASKVVDGNGEPLVVYHGTSRRLNNNIFNSEFIFASDNSIISAGYSFQRKGFSVGIDYALSDFAGEDINSFRNYIEDLIKGLETEIELGENMPFYQEGDLDAKKNLMKELKKAKQEIKNRDIFKEFEFNVFNLFQNIKNPLTVDAKEKYWHSIEFEGTTKDTNEIAKIAKDRGHDGLIITNVIDKGAEVSKNGEFAEVANDYIVFNSNQIKSATDNTEFSRESDNIYENRSVKEGTDITLGFLNLLVTDLHTLIEGLSGNEVLKRIAHRWGGTIFLNKYNRVSEEGFIVDTKVSEDTFSELVKTLGLDSIFKLVPTRNATKLEINRLAIQDKILKSLKILSLFENSDEAKKVLSILDFLKGRLGVGYEVISEAKAERLTGIRNPNRNAFSLNGTAYFIEGKKLTADIAAEEMLHPLVASIRKDNISVFNELLADARKLFPKLHLEIMTAYLSALKTKEQIQETIDNELVTLALSRAFVLERQNNPEGNKAKQLIKKFGNWLVSLFKRQKALELDKIPVTLDTIALLINSDAEIIYNKVKDLFDNISEQENQQQEKTKQQDKMLEQIHAINRQFNRILESKALTSTDLAEVSDVIADMISSKIDEMESKRDQVKEILVKKNPNDNTDVNKLSRFELVNSLGVQHFIDLVKQDFAKNRRTAAPENRVKINEVLKNWDYFISRIKSTISKVEGIHLEVDATGDKKAATDNPLVDQYDENGHNIQDQVEDGQLSWQIENNTIDPITSITQLVKLQLRQLYQLKDNGRRDEDGNILYDHIKTKWGTDAKVGYTKAAKCLLKWLNGKQTLKEMVEVLNEKSKRNPWVTQLLPKLTDTKGKYTTEQSQFFSTFYRPFMKFTNVGTKGGKLVSRQLNEHPFLTLTIKTIEAAYKLGQHPLITNGLAAGAKALNIHYTRLQELVNNFEANKDEIFMELRAVTKGLGFEINVAEVQLEEEEVAELMHQLGIINTMISRNANNAEYDPFAYGRDKDGIRSNLMRFFERLTDSYEDEAVTSFYEGGKMRQSYLLPSFLTMFTNKFHLEDKAFNNFLADEFNSEFMRDDLLDGLSEKELATKVKKGWKNVWLQHMMTDPKKRKNFGCKTSITFNGSTYMRGMTKEEYALAMITEFYGENSKDTDSLFLANFRVPIESNKPSAEYITFYARGGAFFKEDLVGDFMKVFGQELSRMQTVLLREESRKSSLKRLEERFKNGDITEQQFKALSYSINQEAITHFDERGKQFVYLDFLNKELPSEGFVGTKLGRLINKAIHGKKVNNATMSKLAAKAIEKAVQERVDGIIKEFKDNGVFDLCTTIEKIGDSEEAVQKKLEIMLWNDAFASTQIMQLLITDPAFLKNTDDVQKRFAQVHASGTRANIAAVDFEGNPVSDGVHRSITLKDVEGFKSNIIENLTIVLDKKIANSKSTSERIAWEAFKEKLVGKKGLYREGINLTDAQAYSCPTSYRKKALMFGLWSKEAEVTYKRIKDGNYTYSDIATVFQPFKPFVYGNSIEETGVNGPMTKMRVPVQNKNAECLLVMADAILAGEETGRPNLLRALFEVMEDSHFETVEKDGKMVKVYKTDGIDTVNFESAVKSGAQGRIDTQAYAEGKELTVEDADGNKHQVSISAEKAFKDQLKSLIYKTETVNGKEVTNYNRTIVKHLSFENYCMQQSVPEHFLDHAQLEGSQQRALIPSDLATVDANGETIYYEVGKDKVKMTAEELREKYDRLHAENIQKGIEEVEELFMLKGSTPQQRKEALSELLVDQFLKDGRYSGDMLYMVTLNEETGDFPVSLEDPSIRTQVEQAINSIIKSRVNKLKMKGGPLVQMSNFGMSKELKIRFLDKEGNPLMDRSAFDSDEAYKEYVTKNQGGISHFEVIAPAYTEEIFKKFMDKEGNISVEALELLNPDLLKMIGYRIPTEAKYSIAPLKIVGFAPREMGDVIILPAEITLITGSDFDVDKEYCIRKALKIVYRIYAKDNDGNISETKIAEIASRKLANELITEKTKGNRDTIRAFADRFVNDPYNKKLWMSEGFTEEQYKDVLRKYVNIVFKVKDPTGVDLNNNEIFDMSYAVLTSESNVARALKPGGFDEHKHMAYAVAAYRIPEVREKYPNFDTLLKMDTKEIGKLIERNDKNLIFLDTQLEYYDHNNSASSLLGISAVNSVAHAILVDDNIGIDLTGIDIPTIAGFKFGQVTSSFVSPTTVNKANTSKEETQWARTAANSYEVSTQGDSRFSALRARFKPGTIIDGVDVGDKTIEYVYQTVIKKSSKGRAPSIESKLYRPELKTKAEQEDFSYREGYLPLWQEWARQNPELMQELREKSAGKVLTDKFANTRVSQARALAEILNSGSTEAPREDELSIDNLINELDPSDKLGNIVLSRAKDLGVKIKRVPIESDRAESNISGNFKADESTIYIDPDNMQENTLIHEAIHAITSYYFNTKRESLPKEIQAALKEIEYCHELLKQDFIEEHFYENGKPVKGVNIEKAFSFWIDNDTYGLTSPEEMIAEIGKPEFLDRIKKYDAKHKGDKSIFSRLIDAITKLFTGKEYSSVEKTIKDAIMVLFNTPNKELFNKHANEIRTIKENYKTLKSVDKNVITMYPAPKVAEMIESTIGDEMQEYTITLDPYTISGMFRPEGSKNFLTKPAPNTIIEVQVGEAKGILVLTKPAEVISKEEGVKITVVPLDANYLKNNNLEIKVDNHVAHLVNFTVPSDIEKTTGTAETETNTNQNTSTVNNSQVFHLETPVMRLDPSTAADGASIAETLGSNVAAAADAAKDPVLNFMNLNPQTFNVYTTLIRSGMPNSIATLLMSSKVLANAVAESNAKTLAGEWSTPESVLRELISEEFLESAGYSPSSAIFTEELTRDELIRGLYDEDFNIYLKIANALVGLFDMSKKVRLADQVTRFNSTSSAVGPTTLDNYIFQSKLDTLNEESSLVDMSTGNHIGVRDLLNKHKMLDKFSRAYDLANSILVDGMPQTKAFIESMESIYAVPNNVEGLNLEFGLPTIVRNDRALVGKLRDFFTSWSALKTGLVSYDELEYLSKEFPKTITEKKNEHSDNYLVQNLYLNIDSRSGFPIIAMNISKIEETSRDMITASWADLYTKDKEFALNLFKYSFFRGGLGFSPKTFMNVLPIQMKIDMEGYLKIFKEPETLTPQEANLLYKQFVSNNAMDNKLVPVKKASPGRDGRITISKRDKRAESFRNVRFFKRLDGRDFKLYECVGGNEGGPIYRIYKEIPMLGAEGNFIEMSTKNIKESLFDVKFDLEDDGSMKLTPDVNDIPADRLKTIVEARKILNDILTQNQQELTKLKMATLEEEAKLVFVQRASARLSTILQEKGYTPIKEETFNEMLKQLDLC